MGHTSVLRLALDVHRRHSADGGGYLAATITYYGFLSLFPLILLAMSVVGFALAGDTAAQGDWASRLSGAVPGLGPLIGKNIRALVESRGTTGLVGVLGLLWTGTGAAEASAYALRRVFRIPEYGGMLRRKAWATGSTLVIGTLAAAGVGVAGLTVGGGLVSKMLGFVLAFALDIVLFGVAYRALIQRGPSFESVWKGAVVAAAGGTVLKLGGAWLAARTMRDSTEVYGTFGSVVGVLIVLYAASRLFLYGAELNAVLLERADEGNGIAPEGRRTTGVPVASPT